MKTIFKTLSILLIFSASSCSKADAEITAPVKKTSSAIVLAQSPTTVIGTYDGEFTITNGPATTISINSVDFTLVTTSIDGSVESGTAYLVAEYTAQNGESHVAAWPVNVGDFAAACPLEHHSCSGSNCESCKLVRNGAGCVTGCKCLKDSAYVTRICNHNVSTSVNSPEVGYF